MQFLLPLDGYTLQEPAPTNVRIQLVQVKTLDLLFPMVWKIHSHLQGQLWYKRPNSSLLHCITTCMWQLFHMDRLGQNGIDIFYRMSGDWRPLSNYFLIKWLNIIKYRSGRIKTRAAHFWNFLWGLLCTGHPAFRVQYLLVGRRPAH